MYKIRNFKGFNWLGFWTLYLKEVKRFLNVFAQTVLAPAITTLLFYVIFTISVDRNYLNSESYLFSEFLFENPSFPTTRALFSRILGQNLFFGVDNRGTCIFC